MKRNHVLLELTYQHMLCCTAYRIILLVFFLALVVLLCSVESVMDTFISCSTFITHVGLLSLGLFRLICAYLYCWINRVTDRHTPVILHFQYFVLCRRHSGSA
jgi:uncharacterized membrane protein (DUF485 family)